MLGQEQLKNLDQIVLIINHHLQNHNAKVLKNKHKNSKKVKKYKDHMNVKLMQKIDKRQSRSDELNQSVNALLHRQPSESRNNDIDDQDLDVLVDPHLITKIQITTTAKTKSRTCCEIKLNSQQIISRSRKNSNDDEVKGQLFNKRNSESTRAAYKLCIPNQLIINIDPPKPFVDLNSSSYVKRRLNRRINKISSFRRTLKQNYNYRKSELFKQSDKINFGKESKFKQTCSFTKPKETEKDSGKIMIRSKCMLIKKNKQPDTSKVLMEKLKEQEARAKSAQRQFHPNFGVKMN